MGLSRVHQNCFQSKGSRTSVHEISRQSIRRQKTKKQQNKNMKNKINKGKHIEIGRMVYSLKKKKRNNRCKIIALFLDPATKTRTYAIFEDKKYAKKLFKSWNKNKSKILVKNRSSREHSWPVLNQW